jgi:hypothetical protein
MTWVEDPHESGEDTALRSERPAKPGWASPGCPGGVIARSELHRCRWCRRAERWSAGRGARSVPLGQQGFGLLQVGGVKPLDEPAVDRGRQRAGLGTFALALL